MSTQNNFPQASLVLAGLALIFAQSSPAALCDDRRSSKCDRPEDFAARQAAGNGGAVRVACRAEIWTSADEGATWRKGSIVSGNDGVTIASHDACHQKRGQGVRDD